VTRTGGERVGARAGEHREVLEAAVDGDDIEAGGLGEVRGGVTRHRTGGEVVVDHQAIGTAAAGDRIGTAGDGDDVVAVVAEDTVAVEGVEDVDRGRATEGEGRDAGAELQRNA